MANAQSQYIPMIEGDSVKIEWVDAYLFLQHSANILFVCICPLKVDNEQNQIV